MIAVPVLLGGTVALIVGITLLASIPVFLAWNLGVVGISHAVHGHIHSISFWTALGASLFVGVISRIFRRSGSVTLKSKR